MLKSNYKQFANELKEDSTFLGGVDVTKEPYTVDQLIGLLKKAKKQYLIEKNSKSSSKKKIYRLSTLETAYILSQYCHFCWFDNNDDERLHMSTYDPEAGIYRDGERQLRQFIFAVEPSFNKNRASDVIYQLCQIHGRKKTSRPDQQSTLRASW